VLSEERKATHEGRPLHAEVLNEEPSALNSESISKERRTDADGRDLLPRHLTGEVRLPLLTSATVVDRRGHEHDTFHTIEFRSHGEHRPRAEAEADEEPRTHAGRPAGESRSQILDERSSELETRDGSRAVTYASILESKHAEPPRRELPSEPNEASVPPGGKP